MKARDQLGSLMILNEIQVKKEQRTKQKEQKSCLKCAIKQIEADDDCDTDDNM